MSKPRMFDISFLSALFACLLINAYVPPSQAEEGSAPQAPVAEQQVASTDEDEEEPPPGLDRSVIQETIIKNMAAVKNCYVRELRKDPELTGVVTVSFTVSPKGSVSKAILKGTTINNKEVETCTVTEVKSWIFPEPRGGISVDITYPFKFKPTT